jgi:hypothetical protein
MERGVRIDGTTHGSRAETDERLGLYQDTDNWGKRSVDRFDIPRVPRPVSDQSLPWISRGFSQLRLNVEVEKNRRPDNATEQEIGMAREAV